MGTLKPTLGISVPDMTQDITRIFGKGSRISIKQRSSLTLPVNSAGVFAADIFQTNFATAPRDRLAWDRYRRKILEPGSSRDELEMLESFLGHCPNPQRLLGGLRSTL